MAYPARAWIGLALGVFSFGVVLFASLPAHRVLTQLETPAQGYLISGTLPAGLDGSVPLPDRYVIQLDKPAFFRAGNPETVRLQVEQGGRLDATSPLAGSPVSVEASLEMAAQALHPAGSIFQRLEAENPARFQWQITAAQSRAEGTLWVMLHFALPESSQPVEVLLLARPLSLPVRSICGLPAVAVVSVGALGLLAGCALGLSDIRQRWRKTAGVPDKLDK